MDRQDNELKKAEAWLLASHSKRPEARLPRHWQKELMERIAAMEAMRNSLPLVNGFSQAFASLLFRFAGAGALVTAGLMILSHFYGPDLDSQLAKTAMVVPAGMMPLDNLL